MIQPHNFCYLLNMVNPGTNMIALDTSYPIWDQFFTAAPLVVIGSKEDNGYDLAPKHMAMALGKQNYFGFMCTPRHSTYHNIKKHPFFTVSFPRPNQITLTSLAASPRCDVYDHNHNNKPIIDNLPTFQAKNMDSLFIRDAYLYMECELHQIIDGFGEHSLIAGKVKEAYINEDSIRSFEKDEQEMIFKAPLLVYLANGRFAEIKETRAFPFPKDFKL